MGFWFYMFLMTLLIPGVMLAFGHRFKTKGAPRKINFFYGYRTARAMKNRQTWEFAHKKLGEYWWWLGWPALTVALAFMPHTALKGVEAITVTATGILGFQLLLLCVVLVPIERALKRNFDENGNPLGNVEV